MKRESVRISNPELSPQLLTLQYSLPPLVTFHRRLREREGRSEGVSQETCQHVIMSYTRAKCDLNLKIFHFEISWGIWQRNFLPANSSFFEQPDICTVGHCLASGSDRYSK